MPPWRATPAALRWWRSARFGIFFHISIAACRGNELGWGYTRPSSYDVHALIQSEGQPPTRLSRREYEQLALEFNPRGFDAHQWVETAAAAGVGYVVLTAKAHDGFCFWDSSETDYKITSDTSPFGRDIVAEVAKACHQSGMRLGLYYSQRDWHHPGYLDGDNYAYQTYMDSQLQELLTNYGTVDILMFDTYGPSDLFKDWRASDTIRMIRELQPDILINNRLTTDTERNSGPPAHWGDFDTIEQGIGRFQAHRPWESRIPVAGRHWGYRPGPDVYSTHDCVQALVQCAVGDGNLLLGVAPDATGCIPDNQFAPLPGLGHWMSRYGSTIRGTRGYPVPHGRWRWGGATQTPDAVYLHITDPAHGPFRIASFETWNGPVEVLTGGTAELVRRDGHLEIEVFDYDTVDTIIKLSR